MSVAEPAQEQEQTEAWEETTAGAVRDTLEIVNFRAFRHLKIEGLGRVNLIVGRNNVGKTTLLEALFLWANGTHKVVEALELLTERRQGDGLLSISPINKVSGKNEERQTAIVFGEHPFELSFDTIIGSIGLEKSNAPHQFLQESGFSKDELVALWTPIELSVYEDLVNDTLRLLLPELIRVGVRVQDKIPAALVLGVQQSLPLALLGGGMSRVFGLVLALVNSQDGVLLVDEVESGLHYSVQSDVWRVIFHAAKRFNVQVFATTHSWDCIEAFQKAAEEDTESEGRLIRLYRQDDEVQATVFDEQELKVITRDGIEVR